MRVAGILQGIEVETLGPTDHVHRLLITEPDQLDDEVLGWMRQAYEVGEQKHLA